MAALTLPLRGILSLPADRLTEKNINLIRMRLAAEELEPESIVEVLRWCPKTASDELGQAALERFPSLLDPTAPDFEIVETCLENAWNPLPGRAGRTQRGSDAVISAISSRVDELYGTAHDAEIRVPLLNTLASLLGRVVINDRGVANLKMRAEILDEFDGAMRLAVGNVVEDSEVGPILNLVGIAGELPDGDFSQTAAQAVQLFTNRPAALIDYAVARGTEAPTVLQPELIRQLVARVDQLDLGAVRGLVAIDNPEANDLLANSLEVLVRQGQHAFIRTALDENSQALSPLRGRLAQAALNAESPDADELVFCLELADTLSAEKQSELINKIVEHLDYIDDLKEGEKLIAALLASPAMGHRTPEVVNGLWNKIKSGTEPPLENLELVVIHNDQLATSQRTGLINRVRDWLGDPSLQSSLLPILAKAPLKSPHRNKLIKVLLERQDEAVTPTDHKLRAEFIDAARSVGNGASAADKLIDEGLKKMQKSGDDGRAVVELVEAAEPG